jgi:DNA modification methylase
MKKAGKKARPPVKTPPLRLEWRSPAELAENPLNWRRHPETQLAALTDVIAEVGWAGACLYNERTQRLIDGHARQKVALAQGTGKVPVLVGNWTEEQEKKILATLDPLAAMATADKNALDALLRDVQTGSEPLAAMLTELAEANGIIPGGNVQALEDAEPQIDRAEELRKEWGVEPGQLWQLGEHRLLCGDSTKAEDVARVMDGDKPFLMVTDPPYGVGLDQSWRDRADLNSLGPSDRAGKHYVSHIGTPSDPAGKLFTTLDTKSDWSDAFALVPSLGVVYVWHASAHAWEVEGGLRQIGFEPVQQIIWVKPVLTLGRQHYHWKHEPCFYMRKAGTKVPWHGPTNATTVWEAPSPKQIFSKSDEEKQPHPCQKPLLLKSLPIEYHTRPGDVVYDPFLGSGTTLIACEQLGRKCRAVEISPGYVAVALQRFADATGETPVRLP